MTQHIGMLLYPGLTQLDLTGPFEVLSRVPGTEVHLIWKRREPVRADSGLSIVPTTEMRACPPLDVVFAPGGIGQTPFMEDREVLDFLGAKAESARFVTSVCTGSLLLGAAGLLEGRKATTHWLYMDLLPLFGAHPTEQRVVVDGNRITGAGVAAGIDFGLMLARELASEAVAQAVQLSMEYQPEPPFNAGHPRVAPPDIVQTVRALAQSRVNERTQMLKRARGAA